MEIISNVYDNSYSLLVRVKNSIENISNYDSNVVVLKNFSPESIASNLSNQKVAIQKDFIPNIRLNRS
jgi:hypothetical protein